MLLGACLFVGACGDPESDFKSGRSDDPCNGNYPACNTDVGCVLSNSSYTSGTFPGSGQFLVQTTGPATVDVNFFLINPSAAGTMTYVTWFESGCTSNFQAPPITGKIFVGEAEADNGLFTRSQLLSSPGDHLITYQSDATAQYLIDVEITPTDAPGP